MFEAYICGHDMKVQVPLLAGFIAPGETKPDSRVEVSSEPVYCITTLGRSD